MTAARQATVLALVLGLVPLFIVVAGGGSAATMSLCTMGLVLFGLGMISGQAGMVIGGLAPLLFGAALGIAEYPSEFVVLAALGVLGVIGPWCLVMADVSWWIRRDAEVDFRVFSLLARSIVPGSIVGVGVAIAAFVAAQQVDRPEWLVPAAVIAAAVATLIIGEVIRRRRPDSGESAERMTAATVTDRG